MNLRELNDYEIVKIIKRKNCIKSKEFLFFKYFPLIDRFAFKISFYGKSNDRRKDFRQDSYFKFEECLEDIILDKIPVQIRDTWIFGSRFKLHLKNLYKEYSIRYRKEYYVDMYPLENFLSKDINYDEIIDAKKIFSIINITDRLSDKERNIFYKKYLGYKVEDIKKDNIEMTYWYAIKKIRDIIRVDFGNEYYREKYLIK